MSEPNLTLMTAESVTEGHPDKICDQISDRILDAILAEDSDARVAVETVATTGFVQVFGEITTSAYVDIAGIVRRTILDIGYDSSALGFDARTCGVSVSIDQQSPDIARGVEQSLQARESGSELEAREYQGAGDQGMMFGYASAETPDLMPAPIWLAHRLARRLTEVRKDGMLPGLYPDGKAQVTIGYRDDEPVSIETIVLSTQHAPEWSQPELRKALIENVVQPVLKENDLGLSTDGMQLLMNPSGRFVIGGPAADAGLTGRKIIVDTYGSAVPHGGGAFSGKDPSKVDRSAAYAARWVAKTVVAAELASRCQVQLAYAIGSAQPVAVAVRTFGTGRISDEAISAAVKETFDLRPLGIIEELDLLAVDNYADLAAYGHMGREGFPWESTERAARLLEAARV